MPKTLLDWLIEHYPAAKRQTLRRMAQAGRVRVNGRREAVLKRELSEDDRVTVDDAAPAPATPRVKVLYEDADILVLDKPAGLLTSTVPRERRPTLLAMAREYVEQRDPRARLGLIHRLDKDAGGILVFSKNDGAYESLKSQFFHHTVRREYAAVVHGKPHPPSGRIESNLVERADGTVHSTRQVGKGQRAITHYQTRASAGKRSLLRVILETGRKHQIRVHLRERGWPIVGDSVYGSAPDAGPLLLAAVSLTLTHPREKKEMKFELPLPKPFWPEGA